MSCRTWWRRAGAARHRRVDAVDEHPGHAEALNLRRPGERFSVLPTI
jgi:hypothetical protein